MIEEVNTPIWDSKLANKIVLVDFWAPWCQPCKVQVPILEELEQEVEGVEFMKLNIDDNRYLSQKLGVRNIPTLVLYDNGIEVKQFAGIQSKEMLRNGLML